MKVFVYPEKTHEEFGATRFEVESIVVRESALGKDEIDPDADAEYLVQYRQTKDEAMQLAQEIYNRDARELKRSMYGSVTVQEQVVDWYVEEKRIAEWTNIHDTEYIDGLESYAEWKAAQPQPAPAPAVETRTWRVFEPKATKTLYSYRWTAQIGFVGDEQPSQECAHKHLAKQAAISCAEKLLRTLTKGTAETS
jgi:hypothetical protein